MNKTDKIFLPPDLYSRNTVISHLARILSPNEQMRVLDVGGRGAKLQWFFPENTNYTILDAAPGTADEDCEYVQGNAQKIPFSDNNFDIVVSTDMIEHIDKPFRAPVIREMLRVAKKYLILGVPCGNGLIAKAEDFVNRQYKSITEKEHPFLNEHIFYGLPDEEKIEDILSNEGVNYLKIKEGNLMSWYIQQLYAGTQYEQDLTNKKYKFYKYFNENLFELGNLRTPAYRTIFCISKDGEVPEEEVMEELNSTHIWNPEKFMELLEKAFKDLRMVIDEKKEQVKIYESQSEKIRKEYEEADARYEHMAKSLELKETHIKNQEEAIKAAGKSLEKYKHEINEAKSFIQEKEQAIQLLKNNLSELKQNESNLVRLLKREVEINERNSKELKVSDKKIRSLEENVKKSEQTLIGKNEIINKQKEKIDQAIQDLENHQKALREVQNSRAWKAVMFYTKVKISIFKFFKLLKKGWKILTTLGPAVFFKRLLRKVKHNEKPSDGKRPYDLYIEKYLLTHQKKRRAKNRIKNFSYKPVISVIMPVYNVEEKWLKKAIESVRSQWYGRWELCICDDGSSDKNVQSILKLYETLDERIKVAFRPQNGGIVKASNTALKMATGAYTAFLDNDDMLPQNALYEVVSSLQKAKYDLIYSDEDKIDNADKRSEPFFKPDWSPDLLLSHNYICHLAVYKRKILDGIGGLREGFDGSQDYDLLLRFTEKTKNIRHIPKILYHWRKLKGSAAADVEAKPYAFDAAKKALYQALKRRNIKGSVEDGIWKGSYRIRRELTGNPLVSIIIPFKDQVGALKNCVNSILEKSTYKNYEILLVNNGSELDETQKYLGTLKENAKDNKIKIIEYNEPFNYSSINNFAARKAKGEMLLLLNNDTQVLTPGWIEALLEHVQRPEVGAVGAKLLFHDNLVQHAGVLIGVGGIANSSFLKNDGVDHGYFGQADVIRNYSAVTGACLMVRKDLYFGLEGLDEKNLAVTFNDIDFCLRLREKGYLVVYTPYARLYHSESLTRGREVDLNEVKYMQREHRSILNSGDPYYNPNLSGERMDFSLKVMDKVA